MRVVGFGMPVEWAAAAILANPLNGAPCPSYGIGGLALQRCSAAAEAWYQALLDTLESTDDDALAGVELHLFGIAKPSWVLRAKRDLNRLVRQLWTWPHGRHRRLEWHCGALFTDLRRERRKTSMQSRG